MQQNQGHKLTPHHASKLHVSFYLTPAWNKQSDVTSHPLPSDIVVFRGGCAIMPRKKDANQMQPYKVQNCDNCLAEHACPVDVKMCHRALGPPHTT